MIPCSSRGKSDDFTCRHPYLTLERQFGKVHGGVCGVFEEDARGTFAGSQEKSQGPRYVEERDRTPGSSVFQEGVLNKRGKIIVNYCFPSTSIDSDQKGLHHPPPPAVAAVEVPAPHVDEERPQRPDDWAGALPLVQSRVVEGGEEGTAEEGSEGGVAADVGTAERLQEVPHAPTGDGRVLPYHVDKMCRKDQGYFWRRKAFSSLTWCTNIISKITSTHEGCKSTSPFPYSPYSLGTTCLTRCTCFSSIVSTMRKKSSQLF